jgi:hypothetical protein
MHAFGVDGDMYRLLHCTGRSLHQEYYCRTGPRKLHVLLERAETTHFFPKKCAGIANVH